MKKVIILMFTLSVAFILISNSSSKISKFNNISIQSLINIANAQDEGEYTVVCYCNIWGNCKVTGNGPLCASFPGAGDCRVYDSNC